MAEGGNAQKRTGKEMMGDLGEIGTADIQGQDPTGRALMGNNGPHPERVGGVRGYWTC